MKGHSFLIPRGFRPLGIVFIILGTALAIIRFRFGYKPAWLDMKVFALYSHYLDTKFMQVIKNQLIEEIAGVMLMLGLFIIAFTKEKNENEHENENEKINIIRLKSFFIASYLNLIFILISLLFVFGMGFMYLLIFNMGLWLVFYILTFRLLLFKNRFKQKSH